MNTRSLFKQGLAFGNEMNLSISTLNKPCIEDKKVLKKENATGSFEKYSAEFLIEYIINTHHAFAKENAVVIYNLIQKVAFRHSNRHSELKKLNEEAFFFFQDLLNQMLKEEQEFFPFISRSMKNFKHSNKRHSIDLHYFEEKVKLQEFEHAKSLNYLKVFREITNDYLVPPDASWNYISLFKKMQQLEQDLKMHFYLEDDVLFKKAFASESEPRRQPEHKKVIAKSNIKSLKTE